MRYLGRKARGFGPNQAPKIGGLKAVWFWEQQKDVSRCVYPVCRKSRGVLRTFVGRTPYCRVPFGQARRSLEFPMLGARFEGGQILHSCRLASHRPSAAAPPEGLRQVSAGSLELGWLPLPYLSPSSSRFDAKTC
jgi:hypothetical protein